MNKNKEEQANLEILSKIVIQLKTSQLETNKKLADEINCLKSENTSILLEFKEKYDKEIFNLKEELTQLKITSLEKEKNYINELADVKLKFEKSNIEVREDMLRLLNKYEDKFQAQDDDIDILKRKCEMEDCGVCGFQSFKIHYFVCEECNKSICTECLQVCVSCRKARCTGCLIECNNCLSKLCKHCITNCDGCVKGSCKECFSNCTFCLSIKCTNCIDSCRKCEKSFCVSCAAKCIKCEKAVSCLNCYEKDSSNEVCLCGKLYCFDCEDECVECTIPFSWENENRIFQGFHIKSATSIPSKSLVKFYIIHKGIDTSHLGLTIDNEFKFPDRATDNFWSLCLNSGEKFSTIEYKKKGIPWSKYAVPINTGDTILLKYYDGEVKFLVNRKEFPVAFNIDKNLKYYLYCLTHDDSTQIEIKSLKVFK
jgi:hypothetical protein